MEFNKVVIAGGGVLGVQIGLMSAYTGHDTTFWLRSEGSIGRTMPKIEHYTQEILKDLQAAKALIENPMGAYLYPRGLVKDWQNITPEKIDELLSIGEKNIKEKIHIELDMEKAFNDANIVIEAIAENLEDKKALYAKIKDFIPNEAILCTNTSTLLPSSLAEFTGNPAKFCALHFANEIWKHNTAEIMGHTGTDKDVLDRVVAFADEINMIPLRLHKEQPAYILNTLLVPLLDSAMYLWVNGIADFETIDLTWRLATGAPKGPFQILDVIGLETPYNIALHKPNSNVEGTTEYLIVQKLKEKIEIGEKGINAGKGFYDYTK